MNCIELSVTKGMRLHFRLDLDYDSASFNLNLTNKEKVLLHIVNTLKWKISLPEDGCLHKDTITLEAVEFDEDVAKALKALIRIKGLKRANAEMLKNLPQKMLCKELILKAFIE